MPSSPTPTATKSFDLNNGRLVFQRKGAQRVSRSKQVEPKGGPADFSKDDPWIGTAAVPITRLWVQELTHEFSVFIFW